jgi:hypothetical protein
MAASEPVSVTRRSVMTLTGAALALPASSLNAEILEGWRMPFEPKFVDLVRNYSNTTGTGNLVLGSAVPGYTSFTSALQAGDQFYYSVMFDKANHAEVGRGTLQADGTIARDPCNGILTNFGTGTKTVSLVTAAEWYAEIQARPISGEPADGDKGDITIAGGVWSINAGAPNVADKVQHVADRIAVSNAPSGVPAVFLRETGREGMFVWSGADLSAHVGADPNQGIYVAPVSDPTGKSGAWVRQFSGRVNVKWFGATGDGTTDDSLAFAAALGYLNATAAAGPYASGNHGLFIPYSASPYYLGTTTLDVRTCLIIEGESVGEAGGAATHLKWAAGATGIRVQGANTSGATATQTQDNSTAGAASIIRNLYLEGAYDGSNDADYHGIHLRSRASIRDCYVTNFQGNGIYIACDAMGNGGVPVGNANNSEIAKVIVTGCRNGIYTIGGDVNAGLITAADCMFNRQWGISENGFLGNTYVACHTSGNSSGPYQTTNANARNVFLGCYSEGDQSPSSFVAPTFIFGGMHGAGINGTGVFFRNNLGVVTFDALSATSASIDTLSVDKQVSYQSGAAQFLFSGYNGGNAIELNLTANFGGNLQPGIRSYNTGGGFNPFYFCSANLAWVSGADGYVHWTLDNSGMNLGGTYKVNGTQVVGAQQTGTLADATDLASAIALVNDLKAKLIAHGLIA